MAVSKKTSGLVTELHKIRDVPTVDVVVELSSGIGPGLPASTSRSGRLAAKRDDFERRAQPVIDTIRDVGGVVRVAGWLNGTLYARVDRAALDALEQLDEVRVLDVPGDVTFPG